MGEKESKDEHQLDAVLRNNTEFVDVGQKYARKIQLKLSAFNEANRIQLQKQDYRLWYARSRNDPQHSPIASQVSLSLPSSAASSPPTTKAIRPGTRWTSSCWATATRPTRRSGAQFARAI